MGPESLLIDGGYYRCGASQIVHLDPVERAAVEDEMKLDWAANRPNLLAVWRGRAPDVNADSKWFSIVRVPGPCWGETYLDAR